MNLFTLTKNEESLNPSKKLPFKPKNLWVDLAVEVDPNSQETFSMVPKLFKLPEYPPFFHYKDAIDKKLVTPAKLKHQLDTMEQQLRNLEKKESTTCSKEMYMPLPKAKKVEDGVIYYSCAVCAIALVRADHFFSFQHVSRVQSSEEYRQIQQIAEQINPPPVGSKRSVAGSKTRNDSLATKTQRLKSKAAIQSRSRKSSQKKTDRNYSMSNSKSSISGGSAAKSINAFRPSLTANQSRCSTGEYILSSKKMDTPDFASRIFEDKLELDNNQTTSEICLQRLDQVKIRQFQFCSKVGEPEVRELEVAVRAKERKLLETLKQLKMLLKC